MSNLNSEDLGFLLKDISSKLLGETEETGENEGGFVDAPATDNNEVTNVFLVRDQFDYGYLLEGEGQNAEQVPLPDMPDQDRRGEASKGVEGRLVAVEHKLRSSQQYGDAHKLRVRLQYTQDGVTKDFLLHTGFFTNTAKSLLSNLAAIEGDLQDRLVTIMLDPPMGEDANQNVLFTDVFTEDGLILDSEWPENDQEVIDIFDGLRERLGQDPLEEDRPEPTEQKQSGRSRSNNGGESSSSSSGRSRSRSRGGNDSGGRSRSRSRGRGRSRSKPSRG